MTPGNKIAGVITLVFCASAVSCAVGLGIGRQTTTEQYQREAVAAGAGCFFKDATTGEFVFKFLGEMTPAERERFGLFRAAIAGRQSR